MKTSPLALAGVLIIPLALNAAADTRYVDLNNPGPLPPYTSWATAATNIQDAVDAADGGDTLLVTNGVYATGVRAMSGTITTRVVVDKALALRSVNGPEFTVIQGYQCAGTIYGNGAIQCVYLTNGASLSGFTVTNGATWNSGAGINCQSSDVAISNCIVVGNSAYSTGGGVAGGTLYSCSISNNSVTQFYWASGGGAHSSSLFDCIVARNTSAAHGGGVGGSLNNVVSNYTLIANSAIGLDDLLGGGVGGGASYVTLLKCRIIGNSAQGDGAAGGGVFAGRLNNCLVLSNSSSGSGGAHSSVLNNCTVVGNDGGDVGGVYSGFTYNCIIYYNTGAWEPNYAGSIGDILSSCCTTTSTTFQSGSVTDLLTNAPAFVDLAKGDFRLQPTSPCINAGNNSIASGLVTDFDGNPRVVGGTVDIGAYEFQSPTSGLSYAWLRKHGLPIDGSQDFADPDGDGMNNYQEWRCDTDPTDALSLLQIISVTQYGTGMSVRWNSAISRRYTVERATNLGGVTPFQPVATNIIPKVLFYTDYIDKTATNGGPYSYRVGVE